MTIRLPEATNNGRFTRSFVLKLLLVIATAFSLAKNGASRFTFVEYEESSYWFQPTTTTTFKSSIPRLPRIPKPTYFPPLEQVQASMQQETNQTAGQFALDFCIVGFAKCGTSTMSK